MHMRIKTPRTARTFVAASTLAFMALAVPTFASHAQTTALNAGIEEKVRAAFPNDPVMAAVAKCESGFRQFAPDGTVLRGGAGKGYIGIFQIGERLHSAPAAVKGEDIYTIDGNIAYAQRLHAASGTTPWRECVPSTTSATTPATPTAPTAASGGITQNMSVGARGEQVRLLQQKLNAAGFAIAQTGPGAPGNETTTFGMLTRDAVRRFQCAKQIVCEGTEASTGYGRVGPKTRALLP